MIYNESVFSHDPNAYPDLELADLIKFDDKLFLVIGFESNGEPSLMEVSQPNKIEKNKK